MKKRKWLLIALVGLVILYTLTVVIVPNILDGQKNTTQQLPPYAVSDKALAVYNSLDFIADLHCDALLWSRDLTINNSIGHVDFPRMQEANMALQAFTIVTKSPVGQNFSNNTAEAFDNITLLNFLQGRPLSNWFSLFERAAYQSRRLQKFANDYNDEFIVVKNADDLNRLITLRKQNKRVTGGFLGLEGAHCLEGKIENLDKLYQEGVRMVGPTHFFDNELGGSAHGMTKGGLSEFGRDVIQRMDELHMFIDLAHASPALIDDVLEQTKNPVLVSHTGVRGTLDNSRNLSDVHIQKIAANGGLIGVAFFKGAVTAPLTKGIVDAMKYIKAIAGVECIALGSDYDGTISAPFDVTGLPLLVEELLNQGFQESEIRLIMGENVKRFMLKNLK
ncbi:dipeptidase [Kriegella aquimaris]|uniref:Zn-dependent dipeptidase, dipeptidase homolog n=1 Tax=Kriegella aquimaris TaxID=192904 RepID=A0A1G9LQ50_9FLAO|nr:membrane dipeptidase [Kriegella aquimaris]SDL64048.1 Zn-dependent dipeptidase, dipeptidase homolog [Kriegella aquimaris]